MNLISRKVGEAVMETHMRVRVAILLKKLQNAMNNA